MDTPQEWLPALLREVAPKTLWEFLSPKPKDAHFDPARLAARHMAMQGFQSTPSNLRHPTVQKRLINWFGLHSGAAKALLEAWARGEGEWLRSLQNEPSDDALFALLRAHGPAKCSLGAAWREDDALLARIKELKSHPEQWQRDESPATEPERVEVELSSDEWCKRAVQAEAELERKTRSSIEQTSGLEILRERLLASTREIERLKKEERQKTLAASKKLELVQSAAQAELAELKKHDERETRRLNAALRERGELDSTVKVLRKQVRHLNQLLDAEQKKVAALEAHSAQREKPKDAIDPKAVDAVSTPRTTQEKDKPVKVTRPTPLDELFRWMADGHEFRATPREVIRCIDRNDVEFAFRAGLALEGIAPADLPKKTAFLRRLREQNPYYVKVLTEPTQRALVDASNVVRSTKNKRGKGELRNLLGMKKELRRLGFFPIEFIADASLRYNVDDINAYNEMINRGEVEVVTPGTEADELLVRKARSGGGYVVTNDAKFHFKVSPDSAPPSIPFRVFDGTILIDEF